MEYSNISFERNEFGEDGITENPAYQYTKTSFIDADEFIKKPSPMKVAELTEHDIKQYLKGKEDDQQFQGHSWKLNAIISIIFVMSFPSLVLTVVQRFGNESLSCGCKSKKVSFCYYNQIPTTTLKTLFARVLIFTFFC